MQKILRSRLHELFDEELRFQIELLSLRRDIINSEKHEKVILLLQERGIDIVKLGPGTNRYAFRYKGYVIKVATDKDGKTDNRKEFKMAKRLYPHVSKTYEVSENGTLLVAEYIPPFSSYAEMCTYSERIKNILRDISSVFLIGDVGISPNNYTNWGIRPGTDDPVCLDYAYIFEARSEIFLCRKCEQNMLVPNAEFTQLRCPVCNISYKFEDIRGRIGNEAHESEIGNLADEGYRLTDSNVTVELDSERSNYLKRKQKKQEDYDQESENWRQNEMNGMNNDSIFKTAEELAGDTTINRRSDVVIATVRPYNPDQKTDAIYEPAVGKIEEMSSVFASAVIGDLPDEDNIADSNEPVTYYDDDDEDYDEYCAADDELEITAEFIQSHLFGTISMLSNMIGNYFNEIDLYDKVADGIMDLKFTDPECFYKRIQNIVFHSIMAICGCTTKADKTRSEYQLTEKLLSYTTGDIADARGAAILFMQRVYMGYELGPHESIVEMIDEYREDHDDFKGLPLLWLHLFYRIMDNKQMKLSKDTFYRIGSELEFLTTDEIAVPDEWKFSSTPMPSVNIKNITDEKHECHCGGTCDACNHVHEVVMQEADPWYGNEKIYIQIYPNDNVLYLHHWDGRSDELRHAYNIDMSQQPTDMPVLFSDPRNGVYSWLIHLIPDLKLWTNDPEQYLAYNKINPDKGENIERAVILDQQDDQYLIGIYGIMGIYIMDANDEGIVVSNDNTILAKINNLIYSEMAASSLSMYDRNVNENTALSVKISEDNTSTILLNADDNGAEDEDEEQSNSSTDIDLDETTSEADVFITDKGVSIVDVAQHDVESVDDDFVIVPHRKE